MMDWDDSGSSSEDDTPTTKDAAHSANGGLRTSEDPDVELGSDREEVSSGDDEDEVLDDGRDDDKDGRSMGARTYTLPRQ